MRVQNTFIFMEASHLHIDLLLRFKLGEYSYGENPLSSNGPDSAISNNFLCFAQAGSLNC